MVKTVNKDKILFWLNANLTQYMMSYYLHKKYPCDMYAVIDITNKPKKFFETQQFAPYKKTWFFHDNLKISNNVDISFLEKFEKEYEIDLWKLIINERIFYRFFNFHRFSRSEILSILEQSIKLYLKIFDEVKPDFFIAEAPVLHHSELIYQIMLKKNVKCLLLSIPKLSGKSLISEKIHQVDYVKSLAEIPSKNRTLDELQNYIQTNRTDTSVNQYWKTMNKSKIVTLKALLDFILSDNDDIKSHYTYFGRTKLRVLFSTMITTLQKKYRQNFMKRNLRNEFDFSSPYVYFPMFVDMDRNSLIGAPFSTNQIEIIRTVAKSLPIEYKLYVKEHPGQVGREWRPTSQYKEISEIPNVYLFHPSLSGEEFIKNSSLVISIAGASPFEATFHNKPSIVFGDVIYSLIPSVFKVQQIEQLPELIRKSLCSNVDVSDLDKFVELLERNTNDFNQFSFEMKYLHEFYYGGTLINSKLDPTKIEKFLNENKIVLEKLAEAHIEKIKQHKKFKQKVQDVSQI